MLLSCVFELRDVVDCPPTVPLLCVLDPLLLLYDDPADAELPDDTAGLLYVLVFPVAAGLVWFVWLPDATAAFCLVTVLLTAELPPEDLDAVTELRDVVLLPMTPREELLLVPTPLLTVVFPLSVNTRSSLCVSWRGPYHILLEKCPPCPRPGPPWMCP